MELRKIDLQELTVIEESVDNLAGGVFCGTLCGGAICGGGCGGGLCNWW